MRGRKYDVLVPSELGYALPDENVNSDAVTGGELLLSYNGKANDFIYSLEVTFLMHMKFLESYKPRWGNSWDHYRNSRENRWDGTFGDMNYWTIPIL